MNETSRLTFGGVSYDLEDHRISSIVDAVYPIGSIYMSVNSANPSTLFGGTWVQIEDTFLLAAGQSYVAGDTGGEATHTLTKDELPVEHMTLRNLYRTDNGETISIMAQTGTDGTVVPDYTPITFNAAHVSTATTAHATMYTYGGGQAHNIMPPYLAVYMWQRTA